MYNNRKTEFKKYVKEECDTNVININKMLHKIVLTRIYSPILFIYCLKTTYQKLYPII